MPSPRYEDHHEHLNTILQDVQNAARPEPAVRKVLQLHGDSLQAGTTSLTLQPDTSIYMVAIGKAAVAMAPVGWEILGDRLSSCLVTLLPDTTLEITPSIRTFQCGHPLPDAGSIAAGRYAANMLANTKPGDILIALISGGGSAMIECPASDITLEDLQALNQLLLVSGIPIQEINTVRRAISQVKAGGLARMAAPAQTIGIILSDVIGNQLSSIASGPTVLRSASPDQARQILVDHAIWPSVPQSVQRVLEQPPPPKPRTPRPVHVIAASNLDVVEAARSAAVGIGFHAEIISRQMIGEARQAGTMAAQRMRSMDINQPTCCIWGGETTVEVTGKGLGGRNQELALAAAIDLSGEDRMALMAYATDGIDGPTDAAGAIVTGETVALLNAQGQDPEKHLADNNAYPPLAAIYALIRTGPSGTNLNDLAVGLVYP